VVDLRGCCVADDFHLPRCVQKVGGEANLALERRPGGEVAAPVGVRVVPKGEDVVRADLPLRFLRQRGRVLRVGVVCGRRVPAPYSTHVVLHRYLHTNSTCRYHVYIYCTKKIHRNDGAIAVQRVVVHVVNDLVEVVEPVVGVLVLEIGATRPQLVSQAPDVLSDNTVCELYAKGELRQLP
jgi:hypothetical protein